MERSILDSVSCKGCNTKANKIKIIRRPPTIYTLFKCENSECKKPITVRAQDYEDSGNIPVEWGSYESEEEFHKFFKSIKLSIV